MKKIFFALAFAALLACGCQKMNDLESRMKVAENDISALKSDVARLNAAVEKNYSITSWNTTADGYSLTLSDGTVINLKNGKDGVDGEDGDAFFKSVVAENGVLVITLVDGTVYKIPFADYPLKDVKSLTYIPEFSDGCASVVYFKPEDATIKMDFMIFPASASSKLLKAASDGTVKITPYASTLVTRSMEDLFTPLACKSFSIDQDGLLSVVVDASKLGDDFFSGNKGAAVAVVLSDGVSEISSEFVRLAAECSAVEYAGVTYHTARMADGKVWMAENLRYIPEGYVACSDINKVDAGVYMPVVLNDAKTAAVFGTAADAEKQGYLYQSEVALGLKIGDLQSVEQAEALEGARGICPEGWHIPTLNDILGLVGKAVPPIVTKVDAPYYDGQNGSVKLLNADGFNLAACGAVSIQDNTRTSGTLMGKIGTYSYISSGYICGSTYAGSTLKDDVFTNFQFFGLMPMMNKATEAEFTANGSKLSYRIAASVRCVKD